MVDEDASGGRASGGDEPAGEPYEWYRRGITLLESGNPAAAMQLLSRVAEVEPDARSVREALARAQFDAGRHAEAKDSFARIVEADPVDHYAHFGLGLAAARVGDLVGAIEHLSLAAAMRPDIGDYGRALRRVRAHRGRGTARTA